MRRRACVAWISGMAWCALPACGEPSSTDETAADATIGDWAEPVLLNSEHAAQPALPEVAMNDAGRTLVLWADFPGAGQRLWSAEYTPDAGWAPAELVRSASDFFEYRVAVDENGDGIAIWSERGDVAAEQSRVWASRYRADAGWDAPEPLDGEVNVDSLELSMNARGDAFAVWTDMFETTAPSVRVRHFDARAGWSSIETVSSGADPVYGAGIGLCEDGSAVAQWGVLESRSEGTWAKLWANRFEPGAGWGSAAPNPNAWYVQGTPTLECDAAGRVAALWVAAAHPLMSTWFARHDVADTWTGGVLQLGSSPIAMGLDGTGSATIVLAASVDDNPVEALVVHPSTGSVERQPIEATGVDGTLSSLDTASNAAGQALAIWSRGSSRGQDVWVNGYEPGEGWGKANRLVSANPTCGDACRTHTQPRVVMRADGNAIAVWASPHDAHGDVWARVLTR